MCVCVSCVCVSCMCVCIVCVSELGGGGKNLKFRNVMHEDLLRFCIVLIFTFTCISIWDRL